MVFKIGPTALGHSIFCCLLTIGTLTTNLLPSLAPGRVVWDVLATSITANTGRVEPGETRDTGPRGSMDYEDAGGVRGNICKLTLEPDCNPLSD